MRTTHPARRRSRLALGVATAAALVTTTLLGTSAAVAEPAPSAVPAAPVSAVDVADDFDLQPGPEPSTHTQETYAPDADFTSKWTRADARQITRMSDPDAGSRENSMPTEVTMPTVPQDFPDMSDEQVWVWDTWPLTDEDANQYSINGWEVIFSLVADRDLGFDERHQYARIGYFYRPADIPWDERPEDGGWTYGGLVFEDGLTGQIFEDQSFSHQTEWSGSARIFEDGKIKIFFTDVAFYRNPDGSNIKPYDPRLALSEGTIHADENGVYFKGLDNVYDLLQADGEYYQDGEQNEFFNFRDPWTFEHPDHPGETYMLFEGNTAMPREEARCTQEDLGYQEGDPYAETVDEVNASGATYQIGNVGLARATNEDLTEWEFLPPVLSANCVTDQTERPQFVFKDGKTYLFTISHRNTYAAGIDGPEGVYGFVGDGIRSDFQPLNAGSGLALGNPTNLNFLQGFPYDPDFNQHPGAFQAYSHYIMPGGLVQSFIDTIGTTDDFIRGGTLGPTVQIDLEGDTSTVDRSYGDGGLGGWADIPANLSTTVPIYVGRIFGATRYSTAVALSQVYDPGVGTVFVATGDNFPDALAAAARAGSIDAPVLLTRDDSAPYSTLRELDRLNPGQVVVLGGDGAIEDDVVGDIADAAGAPTRRIAGTGRWETAALLAAEFGEVDVAYVATGQTFPDALAASARAGSEGAPVLLVKSDGVPTATADALTELGVSEIVLVGGEGAVDETVEETLESYASVDRVSGRNRYGTAAALSADIAESDTAYVASGQNWPDALAGSARAASEDTPLLLVEPTAVPPETWDALEALGPWDVEVLGGDGAIEDTVLTELRTLE